jgi:hypothetical protein
VRVPRGGSVVLSKAAVPGVTPHVHYFDGLVDAAVVPHSARFAVTVLLRALAVTLTSSVRFGLWRALLLATGRGDAEALVDLVGRPWHAWALALERRGRGAAEAVVLGDGAIILEKKKFPIFD